MVVVLLLMRDRMVTAHMQLVTYLSFWSTTIALWALEQQQQEVLLWLGVMALWEMYTEGCMRLPSTISLTRLRCLRLPG